MTRRTLILRSLRFHARSHIGVVLGAAIGSAVLVGALVVGDSVRESLRERALDRLGEVHWAMFAGDRLFRQELVTDWEASYKAQPSSPEGEFCGLLRLPATASKSDGTARANQVVVYGVDAGICDLGADSVVGTLPSDSIVVNEALADQLNVEPGDIVLLRVKKPSALSQDVVISPRDDSQTALRLKVHSIVGVDGLGNLALTAGQSLPMNAFVSLPRLQAAIGITNEVNEMLVGSLHFGSAASVPVNQALGWFLFFKGKIRGKEYVTDSGDGRFFREMQGSPVRILDDSLGARWRLDDAQLELGVSPDPTTIQLRSSRIFLENAVVESAQAADENARPILTYLANLIISGTNATPYSMVTAAGEPYTPEGMADDEIVVNQWLADDLKLKNGDKVDLVYYQPESGAQLLEATNRFRVRGIAPMERPWLDQTLMPEFPGVAEAASTREWDGGFPLTYTIRDKDEDYWRQHRGTPKAFATLAAGQRMWGNRFGKVTAVRFLIPTNEESLIEGRGSPLPAAPTNAASRAHGVTRPAKVEEYRADLEEKILAHLQPEELGLRFEPVREQALKSVSQAQDFGELFLSFSLFLIVAAMLLMALMFAFGLEERAAETGTLLAVGFPPRKVRGLLLREGAVLVTIGSVLGVAAGLGFAKAMIHGLTTIWRDAVGESNLAYHATVGSVAIGVISSIVVGAITLWFTLRKQARRPVRELLAEGGEARGARLSSGWTGRCWSNWVGTVSLAFALGLIGLTVDSKDTSNPESFFSAGSLLLISGLSFCSGMFAKLARSAGSSGLTLARMGMRGSARRRSRSLAVITLLACGTFLIVAIGAFHMDARQDAERAGSGTGGFALIGEATLPVLQDLNSKAGREFYNLDEELMAGVRVVPFRVREGDEASCLNLTRAQQPRLLGVEPELLEGRFAFAKAAKGLGSDQGWKLLDAISEIRNSNSEAEAPAVGDANSIQWAMGKKVGGTIDYTDGRGNDFQVMLAGAVANSILQGSLIMSENEFVKRFPGESGYRYFLIDAPAEKLDALSAELSRALRDHGLQVTPAVERLNQFNAVQNTYLGTFQVLGGLGLLLGSAGLGVVVLRNVLERRGELALLQAVGFQQKALRWLVLSEHGVLLGLGLAVGVIAAIVAVLPPLLTPGSGLPVGTLSVTLGAVVLNGALWTWLATRAALHGRLLDALRNE